MSRNEHFLFLSMLICDINSGMKGDDKVTKAQMDHIISECGLNRYDNKVEMAKALANEIARLRIDHGYTQDEAAYMLGVSSATYRRIEAGQTEKIDTGFVMKASNLFHTPIMMLFGYGYNLMELYRHLYGSSPRTQRLVQSILDADLKENSSKSEFIPDDNIVLIEFAERIHDGINVSRFMHSISNISEYRYKSWYNDADALLLINSNNYHSLYHEDDKLVISARPPRNGEIGVFIKDDQFYLRRVVESPAEVYLERAELSFSTDPLPIIVNRKSKEDMNQYTKFGTVIAVI